MQFYPPQFVNLNSRQYGAPEKEKYQMSKDEYRMSKYEALKYEAVFSRTNTTPTGLKEHP
jgi:hypothetical protein